MSRIYIDYSKPDINEFLRLLTLSINHLHLFVDIFTYVSIIGIYLFRYGGMYRMFLVSQILLWPSAC